MLVVGHAGFGGDIRKRAIFIVTKQDAGRGIAGNVDVGPAILVEVCGHGRKGIETVDGANSGLRAHVFKRSIAAIVVQRDLPEG